MGRGPYILRILMYFACIPQNTTLTNNHKCILPLSWNEAVLDFVQWHDEGGKCLRVPLEFPDYAEVNERNWVEAHKWEV